MRIFLRSRASWLLLSALVVLPGCAIHQSQQGGYVFNMDLPEVFGTVMDKQPMPDGSTDVSLRKMGSQWSLKFGLFSRVVQLPNVLDGKILHVANVGQSTNILLQTRSAKCQTDYVLVSLNQGAEASVWPLSQQCDFPAPHVKTGQFEQFIDFVVGQRVTRYIFRGGKLSRNKDVLLSPGMVLPEPMAAPKLGGPRVERRPYTAQLPYRPSAAQLAQRPSAEPQTYMPVPSTGPSSAGTNKPSPQPKPQPPTKPQPIVWGKEEAIAPTITIDLRNK